MAEAFALHEGDFGRVALLKLRTGLVAHAHSDSHIVWWLGGAAAQARIGSQVVRYGHDEASAVNAFEQHDLTLLDTSVPAVFLAFYVSKSWLDQKSEAAGRTFVFPSPRIPIDADLRAASWKLLDLMVMSPEQKGSIDSAVTSLIDAAVEASLAPSRLSGVPTIGPLLDHRLRRAISLMREHVEARLTIDEAASRAGLSRARLFALFRDQLNTTPQVMWSALRLEAAIQKLIRDDDSLADVALDLGFSAASNFSRFFKEHTGVSPSEYRRAAAGMSPQPPTERT